MAPSSKSGQMPKTFGETLYGYLKEEILTGEIRSGQRLQERAIAEKYQVSVTPVREAFRRLSAEKLLTINARREVIVEVVSRQKIHDLYEVISPLDMLACRKALKRLTEQGIRQLVQMTDKLAGYHRQNRIREYMKMDLLIHETIWRASGNQFLSAYLVELGEKYAFFCNNIIAHSQNPVDYLLVEDHLQLVKAIEGRDPRRLKNILSLHWLKGLNGG